MCITINAVIKSEQYQKNPLLVIKSTMEADRIMQSNGGGLTAPRHSTANGTQSPLLHVVQVVVNRDDHGYGMKVSGDNPVYVQSVKEGGAAERAGLHAGDKIIKVNGLNVITSTHTDVVGLIRASSQVILTVQQEFNNSTSPTTGTANNILQSSNSRITGPQPVDHEKLHQLQLAKEQHYKLMIEKEQRYVDLLRSQLASAPDDKKYAELAKTERNVQTLQAMLNSNTLSPPPLPRRNSKEAEHSTPEVPPPLPPRLNVIPPGDAVNSINKQMAYPLVATCTPIINAIGGGAGYTPHHQRTKSSPESLLHLTSRTIHPNDTTGGSMTDLNRRHSLRHSNTPPGTPPPPYPSPIPPPSPEENLYTTIPDDEDVEEADSAALTPPSNRIVANSSPIHAATIPQQPIISMEDDDISDKETNQLEDHGHFTSLSRLREHIPHLAIFTNYVLLNSNPNSLLFYLLTDLYKEGNAKEMRKWAFEIHSSFLVPGSPLRLGNVDENIAREIDDVLTNEFDKEEILRKIFWKARARAKDELTRQLRQFQQTRTAGLGTIFGPTDAELMEIYHDRAKEVKLYETIFNDKLEAYHLDDMEHLPDDPVRYLTAAALFTITNRLFGLRHCVDRVPIFVTKEKSFRTKLMGRYSRKLNVQGHQFVAQHYYTVIVCNNCHQIIYGIGPQGYQCSVCLINLHRPCVNLYDDVCPGPINKKDRGLGKFIRIRQHESNADQFRRKHLSTSSSNQVEKDRRHVQDVGLVDTLTENENKTGGQPVQGSGTDRRSDVVREESSRSLDSSNSMELPTHEHSSDQRDSPNAERLPNMTVAGSCSERHQRISTSSINRSESVKEQSEKRKQRRNISDPSDNTTKTASVDLDQTPLSNTDSGRSSNSNISYNGRLSESPSNSVDVVVTPDGSVQKKKSTSDWESDVELEPTNWQNLFPEEELRNLQPHEKKRQNVINELFHTENNHVRNLRVLNEIFYKPLRDSQILKPDELQLIFPNIEDVLQIHSNFNREMKRCRRDDPLVTNLGTLLTSIFTGTSGDLFQKAAAHFCQRQQLALEFIKERRKRDSKFDSFLAECEKKRQCRRLPLQAIVPTEMQRLSKYPLLLERLCHAEESGGDELSQMRRAHFHTKQLLNYVNEATKLALDQARLEDIQRHLDTSNFDRSEHAITQEFRSVDLTRYKLLREGSMQLRRPGKGVVPVHVLLLEEAVMILQKEGDRFLLKFFQTAQPQPLSPIIKISTLLVRTNAVCKNALFLVNTSTNNSQMYDLLAEDDAKRELWFKYFSDAANPHNRRESGKPSTKYVAADSDPDSETVANELATPSGGGGARSTTTVVISENPSSSSDDDQIYSDALDGRHNSEASGATITPAAPTIMNSDNIDIGGGCVGGGGGLLLVEPSSRVQTKITADEQPLVQPSQVHVHQPSVHLAELELTPLERIKRKDDEVKRALNDKQHLLADLLNIPREHYGHIADMAASVSSSPVYSSCGDDVVAERCLAAVYQVDQLHATINDALNLPDNGDVILTGGKYLVCPNNNNNAEEETPQILHYLQSLQQTHLKTTQKVKEIATSISAQLTTLLDDIKRIEDDKEKLRKEVYNLKEALHKVHGQHEYCEVNTLEPAKDLESIKESPAETES